jgi:glutaredoxin-like protein
VRILEFSRPLAKLAVPGQTDASQDHENNKINRALADELAALHELLSVEHHEPRSPIASDFGLERYPAIVLTAENVPGLVRYLGVPDGTMFTTLVQDIVHISAGKTGLSPDTIAELEALETDVHIQIFATPTCEYSPRLVALAHQMAMVSEFVTADSIDVTEFPDLIKRYSIRATPRTVVNENTTFDGGVNEKQLLDYVLSAVAETQQV